MNYSGCDIPYGCKIKQQNMCPVRPGDSLVLDLIFEQLSDEQRLDIVDVGIDLIFEHKLNMSQPDLEIKVVFPDTANSHIGKGFIVLPPADTILLNRYPNYFLHIRITDTTGFTVTLGTVIFKVY